MCSSENTLLEMDSVSLRFGNVTAINDFNLTVKKGDIHALIGPNGAGKTSVLNCISGIYKPWKGRIVFKGEDMTSLKPHLRQAKGIGRTFQNVEIFKGMNVLECLMFGRHSDLKYGILAAAIYKGFAEKEEIRNRIVIEKIIDFLEIEGIREAMIGTLPYGLQRRVSFGTAISLSPDLLLLDEPMAGLNYEEREDMVRFITDANKEWGLTVLMVEHDMAIIMDISNTVTVLNFGVKVADGEPFSIQKNPEVIKAYLGSGYSENI